MSDRKLLRVSMFATLAALFVSLGLFLLPSLAQGQPSPDAGVTIAAPAVALLVAPPEVAAPVATTPVPDVTVGEIKDSLVNTLNQWKTAGWIAGLIALVNFLMLLLRIQFINDWLTAKGYMKYKSWIAGILGAIASGLFGYTQGVGILQAIFMGITAGWAAVGFHQVVTLGNPKKIPQA